VQGAWAPSFSYGWPPEPNRYLKYTTPWSNKGETFVPEYAMPKNSKLVDRVHGLQTTTRSALQADPTSWAHSTGAGQRPPDDLIADHYKPGSQAPKSYGVLEGKEKRVRFVDHKGKEGIMRSDEEIRAIFRHHGIAHRDPRTGKITAGLTKREYEHFKDLEALKKQAQKAKPMPQGPGNIHLAKDPYFLAIVNQYRGTKGNLAPVYWDPFRHEWIYKKVHEEQEKQKRQFFRHQDQVDAKKKKDADAKNEEAQARVEAQLRAKALRDARDREELIQKAKLQNQGQPPIAVHTGLLPPGPKKGGPSLTKKHGPLKDREVARHEAWLKAGKDKARTAKAIEAARQKSAQTLMGLGKLPGQQTLPLVHHAVHVDKVVVAKIEEQPTWVHSHPRTRFQPMQEYKFTAAVARFEGREPVRPRSVQVPNDTTHANVERPPHTDPGPEAPPPRAVLTI
jgi:hypothetical protein